MKRQQEAQETIARSAVHNTGHFFFDGLRSSLPKCLQSHPSSSSSRRPACSLGPRRPRRPRPSCPARTPQIHHPPRPRSRACASRLVYFPARGARAWGRVRRCRVEHAWARARQFSRRFKPPVSSRPSWPRRPWACRSWWSSAGQWCFGVLTRDSFWLAAAQQRTDGLMRQLQQCELCAPQRFNACRLRVYNSRAWPGFGPAASVLQR